MSVMFQKLRQAVGVSGLVIFQAAGGIPLPVSASEMTLVTVQKHAVAAMIPVDGVIEATRQASIAAQVPGRVLEVRVEAGQAVKKGEILMRLDVREANENAAGAQAQFVNSKTNLERTQRLQQQKFVSQAAVDKAKADFDTASANRGAALAGQSHGVIQAPFDGWVAQRAANLGDMVMPGTPLVTVYDPAALRAVANVPQYRIAQLKQVKLAKVEVSDEAHVNRWIESASITVVPAADAATHSTQVRVNLPSGQKDLVPGTYARVHFVVGSVDKLTVPAKAVVRRGEVAAVYVQSLQGNSQGKLSLRQLRLGEKLVDGNGDAYEVLAGLVDGEQVVTDPVQAAMSLKSTAAK